MIDAYTFKTLHSELSMLELVILYILRENNWPLFILTKSQTVFRYILIIFFFSLSETEDNLRQLHGIQESIQRMRQVSVQTLRLQVGDTFRFATVFTAVTHDKTYEPPRYSPCHCRLRGSRAAPFPTRPICHVVGPLC